MTGTCDACRQAHKKCLFVVLPFRPRSQRSSHPRHPCKDSFSVNDDESIPKREWTLGPQTCLREQLRTISPVPLSINFSTPRLGHHLMVTSFLGQSEVIIRPMKDGDGKRTFKLWPIITMSCHPWDSNAKKTWRQATPGLSGTQWWEDSSCAHPTTPHLVIIIDDMPVGSPPPPPSTPVPPPSNCNQEPNCLLPPAPSSSHSYNDTRHEFTNLQPTLMIPGAIN
ncbi:hypothetical protein O181_061429 [Austropuccinia psidii MF-1]|uniref:Uncharacterized protein n=1 Tax=Austropuccinia psidii MF-1 TaxID=1389203 RepID=A0A9Q3EI58_9BASI|nr:hypothetical protein [Austropuccinia psidii MF-1]